MEGSQGCPGLALLCSGMGATVPSAQAHPRLLLQLLSSPGPCSRPSQSRCCGRHQLHCSALASAASVLSRSLLQARPEPLLRETPVALFRARQCRAGLGQAVCGGGLHAGVGRPTRPPSLPARLPSLPTLQTLWFPPRSVPEGLCFTSPISSLTPASYIFLSSWGHALLHRG